VAETVVEVERRLLFGPPQTKAGRRLIASRRVVDELAAPASAGPPTGPVFRSPAGEPLRVFRNRIWRRPG
jgi:hypothetical protein